LQVLNNQIASGLQYFGKKSSVESGTSGFLELFEQILAGSMDAPKSTQGMPFLNFGALPENMNEITAENSEDNTEGFQESQFGFIQGILTKYGSDVELSETGVKPALNAINNFSSESHLSPANSPIEVTLIKNFQGNTLTLKGEELPQTTKTSEENVVSLLQKSFGIRDSMVKAEEGLTFYAERLAPKTADAEVVLPKDLNNKGKAQLMTEAVVQGNVGTEIKSVTQGNLGLELETLVQAKIESKFEQPVQVKQDAKSEQPVKGNVDSQAKTSQGLPMQSSHPITTNELVKNEKKTMKKVEEKAEFQTLFQKAEVGTSKPSTPPVGSLNLSWELDQAKVSISKVDSKGDVEASESKAVRNQSISIEGDESPQVTTHRSLEQNLFQKNLSAVLPTAKEAPTPNLYQSQIHSQLVKSFSVLQQDNLNKVMINLKPEFLGNVAINLTIQNGELVGRIAVAKKEVKELIESQISSLKSSLAQINIKVDQISVVHEMVKDNGQQNQAQNYFGQNSNNSKGNSTPQQYQSYAKTVENEELLVQSPVNSSGGQQDINYLV